MANEQQRVVVLVVKGQVDPSAEAAKQQVRDFGLTVDQNNVKLSDTATKLEKLAASYDPVSRATAAAQKGTNDLLKAYDSYIQKGGDAAKANETLAAGLTSLRARYDATLQRVVEAGSAHSATAAQMKTAASAADILGVAQDGVSIKSNQMREAMVLVHEMLSGNYKRAVGSATIELQNFGLLQPIVAAALSPVGAAIIAGTVALAAFTGAYLSHEASVRHVTNAYQLQGGAVGQSRSDLEAFAVALAKTSDISVREARNIEAAALSAAQVPAGAMKAIGAIAKDYAAAFTDGDLKQAAAQLAQDYQDPIGAAQKLDERLNILSVTQRQQIADLTAQGDKTAALGVLLDALNPRIKGVSDNVTWMGKAWRSVADAASNAWDWMGKWGQSDTLGQQLDAATKKLNDLKAALAQSSAVSGYDPYGSQGDAAKLQQQIANEQKLVDVLRQKADAEKKAADAATQQAEQQALAKQALDVYRSYDTGAAAAEKLTNDQELLTKAFLAGSLTAEQYGRVLDILSQKQRDALNPAAKDIAALNNQAKTAGLTGVAQQNARAKFQIGQRTDLTDPQQTDLYTATARANQEAFAQTVKLSNEAIQQQVADTDLLQEAWNKSSQAGIVAEATVKALAAARQLDHDASATDKQINDQLVISFNQASKAAGDYLQKLQQQRDASAALADAGGDKEAEAQAKITDQVTQQFATEQAIAQAIKDRTGDTDALLQVEQQRNDAAALLRDIHQNAITQALKEELASQDDQISAARTQLQFATKNSEESRVQLAIEQEKANLRRLGVTDLESENAKRAISNAGELAAIQAQADAQAKAYQNQVRVVTDVSNQIERTMSTNFYDLLSGKQTNLWQTFKDLGLHAIADLVAKMAETQFILPIVADIAGVSTTANSGGSLVGNASSLLSTGSSVSQMFGGQSLGQAAGLTGPNGLLSGAGSYLFGTAGTGVGDIALAGTGDIALTTPAFTIAGGETVAAGSYVVPGVAGETVSGAGTSGLLGSGGASAAAGTAASYAAPVVAGGFAGYEIGGAVGSPGGGALAGAAGGAVTGALIGSVIPIVGTIAGAIIGGIAGAIGGAIGGQHPSVGPNSGGYVSYANGTASAGIEASDNGGNDQIAIEMQKAAVAAFNNLSATVGGPISGTPDLRVGTFNGKYFGTTAATGGTKDNATFSSEADAVANGVLMALKQSDLSKVDANVKTAIGNIAQGTDATTISNDLTFAEKFSAVISSWKSGIIDYTQAAQIAAETTGAQLVTSIQDFNDKTKALGLSTQDAAEAEKAAVENLLGLKTSQPISAMEQSVETLYGKLQGVSGLLSQVGIDQAQATASVKKQVEVLLGISAATPAASAYATQLAGLKQTYSDLAPIISSLGISADDAAKALSTAEGNLKAAANDNIQAELDQLTGGIESSLHRLVATFTTTFADIQAVGGDLANAQQLMALQIADLYKPETTAAINAVNTAFQTQISTETNLASSAAKAATDLQTFITSMGVGNLSKGDPQSQLATAKQAFDQAVANSKSSDPTIAANAEGQLTSLAQQYLTASRAYNASGSGYSSDFDYVQQQLQIAEKHQESLASMAAQQVTLLQDQLAAATGIQENTLTTAQAIEKLNSVMAQVNASIVSSIAAAGGGKFSGIATPNGGSSTGVTIGGAAAPNYNNPSVVGDLINTVAGDYQSILGRAPDSSGLSFYVNAVKNGTASLAQVQQFMLNSPEYLAAHSHANGGIASGWSMVGERGPEPVYFGQSAKVFTTQSFREAIGGANDNSALIDEIRALRQEVSSLKAVTARGAVQTVGAISEGNAYSAAAARYASHAAAQPKAASR